METKSGQARHPGEGRRHLAEQTTHETVGVIIDTTLAEELRNPGTDQRYGVNLICRPSEEIIDLASSIQQTLRELELEQYYYYDSRSLHLTLVEVCHSKTLEEVTRVAGQLYFNIQGALASLPAPRSESFGLSCDARGCALTFRPVDNALERVRRVIHERLREVGVSLDPRYPLKSAHTTLLRYIKPLKVDRDVWVKECTGHCIW